MAEAALAGGQSWSAAAVATPDREEAVRDALGGTHLPWDVHVADPAVYGCELAWGTIGDTTLVECRSDPVTGRRAAAELRATGADTVAVLLVLAGRERVRQQDVAVDLRAGDALLWSSRAPVEFEVLEPLHKLTLLVPLDRVAVLRPQARIGPASLPGARPSVRLLTGHLRTLAAVGTELSALDGQLAVDMALDLLATATAPAGPVATNATSASRALLDRALAIISSELGDPDLTPARLAGRLGITPRYLHMVFAGTGETVASHIRRRRIDRVRRDLANPGCTDTVTTIAFRWGFTDSGHLSRAFRAEHGLSPTEFRVRARTSHG